MTYVSPFDEPRRATSSSSSCPPWPSGYRSSALIMRITRSTMLEVLREDYIRTAWAKGQRERVVVWRHALKNASLPVITLIGIEFAFLIGGLIVTETVFNLPGVARYLVDAIQFRDYPIVQNLVMLIAVVVVFANLTVDLLYTWLDPRIKYGESVMADGATAIDDRPAGARCRAARRWAATLWRFVRKNPLGAAGGVLVLAPGRHRSSPTSSPPTTPSPPTRRPLVRAVRRVLAGLRQPRPRPLQPRSCTARASRSSWAWPPPCSARCVGGLIGLAVRLHRRQDRPRRPAA